MKLKKWDQNPILAPRPGSYWEQMNVLNPAACYDNGKVSLLYRAAGEGSDYRIYVGLAESTDGYHFERVSDEPVLGPSEDGFDAGCIEDPRVVKMGDSYYMVYAARAHPPHAHWQGRKRKNLPSQAITWVENLTRSGIARSRDLRNWERLGPCTSDQVDNRDVLLFPEKINGKYVLMHRPLDQTGKFPQYAEPAIWLSFSEDMKTWEGDMLLARGESEWESRRIGGGCPPIKTPEGWLTIYHAVGPFGEDGRAYRAGVMLLDLEDPTKIIAHPKDYILEPEEEFERKGAVPNVVFPCGNVVIGEELFVYYGAADKVCCVATVNMKEFMDWVLRHRV